MTETEQSDWRRLLTVGERAKMLQDIARVSLALGARLFPEDSWANLDVTSSGEIGPKSPLEQLGFIENALPCLTQAVEQIGRNSYAEARSLTRPVSPPIRARRVRTPALLEAARRGPSLRTLNETITTLSLDTPENRAVSSFLRMLLRDSLAIGQIAAAEEQQQAEERAAQCVKRLRGLRAMPWWEEVNSSRGPEPLKTIQWPEYRRVLGIRDDYRRAFRFDWSSHCLTLPSRETWRLYETWCLFSVLEALIALGFAPRSADLFAVKEGRLALTLATDAASRLTLHSPEGVAVLITYQQTFAEGRNSRSHTMQPDIVLASANRQWILDAKFKSYALPGDEGSDINQMHAYRDAITDNIGSRNVTHAWCLYAGQVGLPNRPRLTYGRADDAEVGALNLRPSHNATITTLRELLAHWLLPAARPLFPQT